MKKYLRKLKRLWHFSKSLYIYIYGHMYRLTTRNRHTYSTYIHTHFHIFVRMYIHTHARIRLQSTFTYRYMCTYICICRYVCMYLHFLIKIVINLGHPAIALNLFINQTNFKLCTHVYTQTYIYICALYMVKPWRTDRKNYMKKTTTTTSTP